MQMKIGMKEKNQRLAARKTETETLKQRREKRQRDEERPMRENSIVLACFKSSIR